ncbi:hypothetical protein GCM10010340_62600 [Streptomyces griseoloalbus]|nr:hypothetical protein GCM10010294_43880 [Streptomyces griseoloalbus]GGW75606.1 hypothetical protein GCM10010340_62600 [Streptomyces albaduncus]
MHRTARAPWAVALPGTTGAYGAPPVPRYPSGCARVRRLRAGVVDTIAPIGVAPVS